MILRLWINEQRNVQHPSHTPSNSGIIPIRDHEIFNGTPTLKSKPWLQNMSPPANKLRKVQSRIDGSQHVTWEYFPLANGICWTQNGCFKESTSHPFSPFFCRDTWDILQEKGEPVKNTIPKFMLSFNFRCLEASCWSESPVLSCQSCPHKKMSVTSKRMTHDSVTILWTSFWDVFFVYKQ